MDDEHDDTLLANCRDVHNIKEIKEKDIKINYWILNYMNINFLSIGSKPWIKTSIYYSPEFVPK